MMCCENHKEYMNMCPMCNEANNVQLPRDLHDTVRIRLGTGHCTIHKVATGYIYDLEVYVPNEPGKDYWDTKPVYVPR